MQEAPLQNEPPRVALTDHEAGLAWPLRLPVALGQGPAAGPQRAHTRGRLWTPSVAYRCAHRVVYCNALWQDGSLELLKEAWPEVATLPWQL